MRQTTLGENGNYNLKGTDWSSNCYCTTPTMFLSGPTSPRSQQSLEISPGLPIGNFSKTGRKVIPRCPDLHRAPAGSASFLPTERWEAWVRNKPSEIWYWNLRTLLVTHNWITSVQYLNGSVKRPLRISILGVRSCLEIQVGSQWHIGAIR